MIRREVDTLHGHLGHDQFPEGVLSCKFPRPSASSPGM